MKKEKKKIRRSEKDGSFWGEGEGRRSLAERMMMMSSDDCR